VCEEGNVYTSLKDQGCNNMLAGQVYCLPQAAVIDEYGATVE